MPPIQRLPWSQLLSRWRPRALSRVGLMNARTQAVFPANGLRRLHDQPEHTVDLDGASQEAHTEKVSFSSEDLANVAASATVSVWPGRRSWVFISPLSEGKPHLRIHASVLRDHCPQSRSPSSGNKNFSTGEIPLDIQVESVERIGQDQWKVTWKNDIPRMAAIGHHSVFSYADLMSACRGKDLSDAQRALAQAPMPPQFTPCLWDRELLEDRKVHRIDYNDWVNKSDAFDRGSLELERTGLIFLYNVPKTMDAVKDIGLRFGALQETFYGRTWNVKSKPNAENVAYTSEYLGLHSDLLYLETPPALQLLHCLENEASGGESMFTDAHMSRAGMDTFYRHLAKELHSQSLVFHYNANGHTYARRRRVFAGSPMEAPAGKARVNWSPPFQAQLRPLPEGGAGRAWKRWFNFHEALNKFQHLLEHDSNVYHHRLQPGECVIFDNLRVLHGRTAFDASSGPRHLHGAYVARDVWNSALMATRKRGVVRDDTDRPATVLSTKEEAQNYLLKREKLLDLPRVRSDSEMDRIIGQPGPEQQQDR